MIKKETILQGISKRIAMAGKRLWQSSRNRKVGTAIAVILFLLPAAFNIICIQVLPADKRGHYQHSKLQSFTRRERFCRAKELYPGFY